MSKTGQTNNLQTVNVTSIPPGIDVVIKGENGEDEIVLPALVVLHQTPFGEEAITERIVLGILNLDTGEIMAAEPDQVCSVLSGWFDNEDEGDGDEASNTGMEPLILRDSDQTNEEYPPGYPELGG